MWGSVLLGEHRKSFINYENCTRDSCQVAPAQNDVKLPWGRALQPPQPSPMREAGHGLALSGLAPSSTPGSATAVPPPPTVSAPRSRALSSAPLSSPKCSCAWALHPRPQKHELGEVQHPKQRTLHLPGGAAGLSAAGRQKEGTLVFELV